MNSWKWYVYIIECLDGSYNVGKTWSLDLRYEQHLAKIGGLYTQQHGVKRLVYFEEHNNAEVARMRELQIKKWTRKKKEKLITGEWSKDW